MVSNLTRNGISDISVMHILVYYFYDTRVQKCRLLFENQMLICVCGTRNTIKILKIKSLNGSIMIKKKKNLKQLSLSEFYLML